MTPAAVLGVCVSDALQSALVVGAVAAFLAVCRNSDATTRHRVWFLALLTTVALPLVDLSAAARTAPVGIAGPGAAVGAGHGVQALAQLPISPGLAGLALGAWALGSLIYLTRLSWSFLRLERLRRKTLPVSAEIEASVQAWARKMGIARHVSIRTSSNLASPIAIGLHRPLILVPDRLLTTLSEADVEYIFVHELAHLRRRDDVTNLFAKIARALFVFNPALFVIDRKMAIEREIACDDWVVATLGRARRYARCLAHVLLFSPPQTKVHGYLPFFRTPQQSVHRIEMLLSPRVRTFRLPLEGPGAAFAVAAGILGMGLGFAAAAPPLVAFDSPSLQVAIDVHLDALRRRFGEIAPVPFAHAALRPAPARVWGAQPFALSYRGAHVRPDWGLPAHAAPAFRPTLPVLSERAPGPAPVWPERAAILASDTAAAAEVAQRVTFGAVRAAASRFGVGTPIVPPHTPAISLTYNSIVLTPAMAGGAAASAGGIAGAGTAAKGGTAPAVQLPGGSIAAPAVTIGRGELPGARK